MKKINRILRSVDTSVVFAGIVVTAGILAGIINTVYAVFHFNP